MHGTAEDLNIVVAMMQRQGRLPLLSVGPLPCAPGINCYRMHLVVSGAFEPDDMDDIGARLGWRRTETIHLI